MLDIEVIFFQLFFWSIFNFCHLTFAEWEIRTTKRRPFMPSSVDTHKTNIHEQKKIRELVKLKIFNTRTDGKATLRQKKELCIY